MSLKEQITAFAELSFLAVTIRWTAKILIVAAGFFLVVSPGLGAGPVTYNRPSAIFPAGDAQRGKMLAEPCLACHGETLSLVGDPPFHPPKLQHQRTSSIFYALEDYKTGRRTSDIMAPMAASLSEQDMRDLSVDLAGQRGEPHPAALPTSPGHSKVAALCGFCHGETGMGVMDGIPILGGQHQDYLAHALSDYKSGLRLNETMRIIARTLSPEDIQDLTIYFSAQSPLEVAR